MSGLAMILGVLGMTAFLVAAAIAVVRESWRITRIRLGRGREIEFEQKSTPRY